MFIHAEFCSGKSLRDRLQSRNKNNEEDISREDNFKLFNSIVDGMVDIHAHSIVHRDLKPDNIFFQNGVAKIGDFGLARNLLDEEQESSQELSQVMKK